MHEDGAPGVGQTVELVAWGIAGEVRVLLGRAQVMSGFSGCALSLRDLMVPRVQVEARVVGSSPTVRAWLLSCCSWGREPSGGGSERRLLWDQKLEGAQTIGLCSGPCELAWLEFQMMGELSSGIDWYVQLFDTDPSNPDTNGLNMRAQWLVSTTGGDGAHDRYRRIFKPAEPLAFARGAYLALSYSPAPAYLPWAGESPTDYLTAQWQLRRGSALVPPSTGGRG